MVAHVVGGGAAVCVDKSGEEGEHEVEGGAGEELHICGFRVCMGTQCKVVEWKRGVEVMDCLE